MRAGEGDQHFARVKIPDTLPQLVPLTLPSKAQSRSKTPVKEQSFVWLEQLVTANLEALFPGMQIVEAHPFHVTRDAESEIQDLEAGDLLESVEEGVWQRRFADVVRVEIDEAMPAQVLDILTENLELDREDIYKISGGPLSLVRVRNLTKIDRPDLKYPPFVPAMPAALLKDEEDDIFAAIRRGDFLLQHPFDSFQPVVGLLQKAARDPNVLAIKITLYRVGHNAPVVDALLDAVENGKQVAVLLELKARFDEESNIEWARKLEEYGVHVVYGLLGLKVHCKVAADRAQGRRCHSPLRPSFHRQLQQRYGSALYRHRDDDLRSRHRRRLHRPVQLPHRIFGQEFVPQVTGGPGHHARSF